MPRLLAVADGGGGAAVGDRADEVGLDRGLAGELDADAAAGLVDRLAADHAVGAGEVDLFEDAEARRARLEGEEALHALGGRDHHLAGLDLAHEVGADDVEGAGLGGEDPGVAEAAEHQRADAEGVADADELGAGHGDDGEGALDAGAARPSSARGWCAASSGPSGG